MPNMVRDIMTDKNTDKIIIDRDMASTIQLKNI